MTKKELVRRYRRRYPEVYLSYTQPKWVVKRKILKRISPWRIIDPQICEDPCGRIEQAGIIIGDCAKDVLQNPAFILPADITEAKIVPLFTEEFDVNPPFSFATPGYINKQATQRWELLQCHPWFVSELCLEIAKDQCNEEFIWIITGYLNDYGLPWCAFAMFCENHVWTLYVIALVPAEMNDSCIFLFCRK